jgi:hypothetical protein
MKREKEAGVQPQNKKKTQRGQIVNARGQSTTNNTHDRGCESTRDHSTLSLFSSPPPGGSLYNIRLADDGTVHPSRSRVFKPVRKMKNKQLMAEISRSHQENQERKKKRGQNHCQNGTNSLN